MSTVISEQSANQDQSLPLVPTTPPSLTGEISVPSQMTFAQEVRSDRLSLIWKITLFLAFTSWWVLVVISGGQNVSLFTLFLPTALLGVSSLATGRFLKVQRFNAAVWTYAIGSIAAVVLTMGVGEEFGSSYIPYVLPLLIFIIGLLLPMRASLLLVLITLVMVLVGPTLLLREFTLSRPTVFALILTLVAAALSAQVSGELYAIAEWALENYRRERSTTHALFENREALQHSLLRQQALTDAVQKANHELEVARKAEEEAKNFRGQFLANMSHELRTPLNAIIGFSQTMLDFPAMYDTVDLPAQYRQDMTQILASGKHLLNIINDILDLSKVDAGKLDLEIQPVDLAPVIKGVLSTAVGLVGEKATHIKLQRKLLEPLPMVLGDPLRVRQVLLNLYSNAAKFTDTGHIKLIVNVEDGDVIFAVEDTGTGIPEADRATIFEEFRQGTSGRRKGRQGAGLGLAISQQLLKMMNGRLWVESTVGKGSTFYFSLPRYIPPQPVESEEPDQGDKESTQPIVVPTIPAASAEAQVNEPVAASEG